MNVKEGFIPDTEGLLGFVNLSGLHLLHPGRNYLLFYAQQPDIEITLANRLSLKDKETRLFPNVTWEHCSIRHAHFARRKVIIIDINRTGRVSRWAVTMLATHLIRILKQCGMTSE